MTTSAVPLQRNRFSYTGNVRDLRTADRGVATGSLLSGDHAGGGPVSGGLCSTAANQCFSLATDTERGREEREREIAGSQQGVKEKNAANLKDPMQEKVLISSGQQLLANMTGDIHRQLSQWPIIAHTAMTATVEAFQQWGINHLAVLERFYSEGDNPDISKDALQSEWISLKQMFFSTYKNTTMQPMLKLLVSNTTLRAMYPEFSKLASIALIIPISTAECERRASQP